MHVVIYCPGMPFNGSTLKEGNSLGGSESAAYYLAREMARLGHHLTLFTAIQQDEEGVWEGVRYLSAGQPSQQAPLGERFEWYASHTPHDVLIIQRAPQGFHRTYGSKVNFWWTHDLALRRSQPAVTGQLWNVDKVLAVSEFHRRQVAQVCHIKEEQIAVIPNGVDHRLFPPPKRWEEPEALRAKRDGGVMVYSSRPERGLELLVGPGGVMERLARLAPELTLKVAGYDNTAPQMRAMYEDLWGRCNSLPNVELMGPLSKKRLAELMSGAWLQLYPTRFEEVSCITAMESQAAGTPILTSRLAALPETLADGGALLLEPEGEDLVERTVEAVLALRRDSLRWNGLHAKALEKAKSYNWRESALKVEALAQQALAGKCANPDRLARHLLRYSDVEAAKLLLGRSSDGVAERVRAELEQEYGFMERADLTAHNEALSRFHLQAGEDPGLADPARVGAMGRFQVVEELLANLPAGAKVLDYGCGQGHFTLWLAARYPALEFVGVDIAPSNIRVGQRHVKERELANVRLLAGQMEGGLLEGVAGEFDLVMALEVLEHVAQPAALADGLEALLRPDGRFCATVPYGPWEAATYDTLPVRAHLHHLERADLAELWGGKPEYRLVAIPTGHTPQGEPLGAYRVTWRAGGKPSGQLDYQRKLATQAPKETVSLCMIVGPQGHTLARALESAKGVADQLVVGVDGGDESSQAWQIALRYGAEVFGLESPLKTGFDAARNQTLERASCDWVLWLDDDEVLEWPERLWKYLRPNGYDGYAIQQHHYAAEPPGVIKTDYPCRLFRNRPGVRFYGVVHEHPETGINQGLGHVLVLPDVAICHNGYDTEAVRRRRFARNLPLMVRDRKRYPDRLLGKFLWIRDLAQMNRFELEQQGGVSPAMYHRAGEAVALWRELASQGQLRMALDALPYYSEAVALLHGEGIDFSLAVQAAKAGVGGGRGEESQPVRGRFLNTEDIRLVTQLVLDEKTARFEERYF